MTSDRNEACVSHHGSPYKTGCLPNVRSDDFHLEQNALRLDALLNVGELLHRHRRWSARDFHQHAFELVEYSRDVCLSHLLRCLAIQPIRRNEVVRELPLGGNIELAAASPRVRARRAPSASARDDRPTAISSTRSRTVASSATRLSGDPAARVWLRARPAARA